MSDNINRAEGGGPWSLPIEDDLAAGESLLFDLERMAFKGRDRYFSDWLPMDNVQIKNLDGANAVEAEFNSRFHAHVEPNAVDGFDRAGVTKIEITNVGGSTIAANDLVVLVSVDQYDADQAALERKRRGPIQNAVRGVFNL